jgi:hypothetical protein
MNKKQYTKLLQKLGTKFKTELNADSLTKEQAEEYLSYPEKDVIKFEIPITVKDFKAMLGGE